MISQLIFIRDKGLTQLLGKSVLQNYGIETITCGSPSLTMTDHHWPSLTITDDHWPWLTTTVHGPSRTITDHHCPWQTITDDHWIKLTITCWRTMASKQSRVDIHRWLMRTRSLPYLALSLVGFWNIIYGVLHFSILWHSRTNVPKSCGMPNHLPKNPVAFRHVIYDVSRVSMLRHSWMSQA